MKTVQLHDKTFELFIPQEEIEKRINVLSQMIIKDLGDTKPVFISVLNGAFMFTSEIVRRFPYNCEVDFLKISSYVGTTSSGNVNLTTNSIKFFRK